MYVNLNNLYVLETLMKIKQFLNLLVPKNCEIFRVEST